MHRELGSDEHVVLLKRDFSPTYSVCLMRPKRQIAMSPNYKAGGDGLLSGPLNGKGLDELLQWVGQKDATERFRALARLPENVVALFLDKVSP